MKITKDIFFKTLRIVEIIVSILICAGLLVNLNNQFSKPNIVIKLYTSILITCFLTAYFLRKILFKKPIYRIVFLALIAFGIRVIVCYYLNVEQNGDYRIYLSTASKICQGTLSETDKFYYGIFPHAYHYPSFISLFYRIFGELTFIPKGINILLGTVETVIAGIVIEKLINPTTGLIAGIATALNPSILVFTLMAGGEPIYGSLLMCSILFLVLNQEKPLIFYPALAGLFLGLADFFRPTGIIFIIAIVIVSVFYDKSKLKDKSINIGLLLLTFIITVSLTGAITSGMTGYKKPSSSYGWNLFVGANTESMGKWNQEDAQKFNEIRTITDNPSVVQEHFAKEGFERYGNMKTKTVSHFKNKINVWTEEEFTSNSIVNWQTSYTRFSSKQYAQNFSNILYYYNLIIIIGVIVSLFWIPFRKNEPLGIKLIWFYTVGILMIFMILETASRYKGAYYSVSTIFAVYGYHIALSSAKKTRFKLKL